MDVGGRADVDEMDIGAVDDLPPVGGGVLPPVGTCGGLDLLARAPADDLQTGRQPRRAEPGDLPPGVAVGLAHRPVADQGDVEVRHAEDEGIKFMFLTNPVRFLGDKRNWLRSIDCVKMELSEPDASGRRKPKIIDGSNFSYDCDVAVVAVGTSVNPLIFDTTPDIKRDKDGYIIVDPNTMETSKRSVYAGGDIVTGSATVIQAMGAGRKAAKAIHERLMSNISDPQNQLDPDIVLPI